MMHVIIVEARRNIVSDVRESILYLFRVMIGAAFSKRIGKKYVINFTPFMKYNLVDDYGSQSPDYRNIPDDKMSVGCRLGVELLFAKKTNINGYKRD